MWRKVLYKGTLFTVSEYGNVIHKGRFKQRHDCNGYYFVFCEAKKFPIHHLVCKAFKSDYTYKCIPNHLDANKHNNHYSNFKCGTLIENIKHAHALGLVKKGRELWKDVTKTCYK